jgi:hypothetical protein
MRRGAQPPHLDYGANGDREIQPVLNMRMRNITLYHLDCGISRDQPCEWGIEWDTCGPGSLCCVAFRTKLSPFGDDFPPKSLTHSNDAELELQSGRAYPAVNKKKLARDGR